mmetsp:Transcript_420/g.1275  ORF Transcript_420/g.1275 Transcript_420/m.1275 type:complete len:353 (+) Transcript_420:117-1175(+)|eukprot:CAMPEP_0117671628 /NCGR_PEP_ID=MMETSP0804-20121206/13446_1 /TAXON_ID=1074897 /ORGANISM="Tetraselmis astigmatica, Strain CCMP880" /LENGTH=352 /DNA_ID=CAMNT_0005480123 /DNA_START=159 /DNA_END=1217 /DNA_ORIENTATION=-
MSSTRGGNGGTGVILNPPEVICRTSSPKLPPVSPGDCDSGAEVDMTDWQSVVKEMLSIHLPTSQHQPTSIRTSPKSQPPVPPPTFSPAKTLPVHVTAADLDALGSGSPKASRSPMAASSPRNSTSGLLLVRIDESQALDTSSDCGDTSAEMMESLNELDQIARPMRASDGGGGFRRSRLAGFSRGRSTSTGDADLFDGDAAGPSGILVLTPEDKRLGSGPAALPGLSAKRVSRSSLSKYHPDAPPLASALAPDSNSSESKDKPSAASHTKGKMMRRSVVQRISDHGCEEDEEMREDFADERLTLDGMKRDVEKSMQSRGAKPSRRLSDSSQAFSWAANEASRRWRAEAGLST